MPSTYTFDDDALSVTSRRAEAFLAARGITLRHRQALELGAAFLNESNLHVLKNRLAHPEFRRLLIGHDAEGHTEWLSAGDLQRPLGVAAACSSGWVDARLGLLAQVLHHGGGAFILDGRGDLTDTRKAMGLAKAMGREKDVLVVNFMRGNQVVWQEEPTGRAPRRNPFANSSEEELVALLDALLEPCPSEYKRTETLRAGWAHWRKQVVAILPCLAAVLVHARRLGLLPPIDARLIRALLAPDHLIGIALGRTITVGVGGDQAITFDSARLP